MAIFCIFSGQIFLSRQIFPEVAKSNRVEVAQSKEARLNFQTEVANRKDLRAMRIFTIDPATAKDLDDAIHVIPGACFLMTYPPGN